MDITETKKKSLKRKFPIDIRDLYNKNIDFYIGPKDLSFETYYFDCDYVKDKALYIRFSNENNIEYEKIIVKEKRKTYFISIKNKKSFETFVSNFNDYDFYIIKTPE